METLKGYERHNQETVEKSGGEQDPSTFRKGVQRRVSALHPR
jgi:hypothetical protein